MVSVQNFEEKQLLRIIVLPEAVDQVLLLEHMRKVRSVLQVRLSVLRQRRERDPDLLVPDGLVVDSIPRIESWSGQFSQSCWLEKVDVIHDPDELLVDLRMVQALHDLVLRVPERAPRDRLSNAFERRHIDEVACVPRRLRADDGDLRFAFEIPLDGTDRQLKFEAVVRTIYV